MVVAVIALIVALGGTSYAAVKLPKASVGNRELKKNAVGRANIKNNAVTGAKIAANSITGADINATTLGQVPLAARALAVDHANAAGALDQVNYRTAGGRVDAATLSDPTDPTTLVPAVSEPVSAGCDPGQVATGGGAKLDDASSQAVRESYPTTARTWTVTVGNDDETAAHSFTVFVVCIPTGIVG